MSLFHLSNNIKNKDAVINEFQKLFGKEPETIIINKDFYLTISSAYKNEILRKKTTNGNIFGFGTLFSKDGFGNDVLKSIGNWEEFIKYEKNGLYGHYILIFQENEEIRIITDKVGMLNVYFSTENESISISNDLLAVSLGSGNSVLSREGSQQFIIRESNVGRYTVFKNIYRLGLGNTLKLANNMLNEDKFFSYKLEKLSFDQYIDRLENYFHLINKYNGRISADLSGGYDTRIVAAIGSKTIRNLEGNTNPNKFDGGVDIKLAPIIAQKLGIKYTLIENRDHSKVDKSIMINGFSIGRDIYRSSLWPSRMKEKYSRFDLILGGYGGEIVRVAKNNKSNTIMSIVDGYYYGKEAKVLFKISDYRTTLKHELDKYLMEELDIDKQKSNWLYAIDRMRIWGGSQVLMASLYGDILHPFMDWHLFNPLLSWDINELKNAKTQEKIINYFSPQLKDIPVNCLNPNEYFINKIKKRLVNRIKYNNSVRIAINSLIRILKSKQNKNNLINFYEIHSKENFNSQLLDSIGIDLKRIEKYGDINMLSRLLTLIEAKKYSDDSLD